MEDRLSERSDPKFDENTRNSISSETSSFEVIRTPRDDASHKSNPALSPSKDSTAIFTPRGSKEFPNLAVKFPVQQPELPKTCGWKQESLFHKSCTVYFQAFESYTVLSCRFTTR